MTAPTIAPDTTAAASDVPEGAAPIVLPVMVIEGLETSDRRYIEPGSVEVRDLPIPLYAATRSTHGDTGDAATWHVGAITHAERIPGPEAKLYGGQTLPDGTFAWVGRGWMYKDVPAEPAKSAYQLVKDRALRGNSVDMTEVVAEFQGPNGELADQNEYARISMQRSVIAATTLVGIPAFSGAYITLDGEDIGATREEHELVASSAAPAWLSAELGDLCHSCRVDEHFAVDGLHEYVTAAKRDRAEDAGHAMPGGRYPIENEADLAKAIKAVGRAGGPSGTEEDRDKVRRHIIKQAKRLRLADKIPDTWNSDGTLKTGDKQAAVSDRAAFDFEDDGVFGTPAQQDFSTSGMVALIPVNPQMLVVPGGDPAGQLHLTLAYLGDQVDTWEPDMVAAVHQVARRLTDFSYLQEEERAAMLARGVDPSEANALPSMSPTRPQEGPLDASIFSHAVFNPNGDNGHDPATVYLLDGQGDREAIEWLRNDVVSQVRNAIGDVNFPDQHQPFLPHVTAGYGLDPNQVTYTGPVTFDRIRVAIGEDVTDYPLGGGDAVLVASAADLPPVEWFEDPKLDGPTPFTVTDDGRVYGHLANWDTCHTGFADRCTTPPRSASNYAYFRVHGARARTSGVPSPRHRWPRGRPHGHVRRRGGRTLRQHLHGRRRAGRRRG
jgi:2'-5' RNA ligase